MKHDGKRARPRLFLTGGIKLLFPSIAKMRGKLLVWVLLPLTMSLGCSHQDRQSQPVSRPVKVVRVGDQSTVVHVSFAGEVKARFETPLAFRVAGKLLERKIDVGDRVHKGQILAKLDQTDYRLAVRNLQAQYKAAVAERDFLRNDRARYRELLLQHVITPPEFEKHDIAYITAQERAAALEAQLDLAANQLAYTELRADQDGVVTALEAEAEQVVNAGQAIIKLARLDEKEIHFDVPEHRLPQLARQQEVDAVLWTDGSHKLKARIREIASSADPASRTYRIKATLIEGLVEAAQLGMTATVWIPMQLPSRTAIPLSAVFTPQNKPDQPTVWLVDESTYTVRSVPVRLGETLDGARIAVEGLSSGQLLVSAGVQRLAEGQGVRLPEENASAIREANTENRERQL